MEQYWKYTIKFFNDMNNSMGEVDALLLDDKNFDRYEFVWIIKMISKRAMK